MSFDHQHILITGGSRGLGRALGQALAARGANVTLVARDAHDVARAARQIGPNAYAIAADIADPQAATRIVGEAAARFGSIDILIHAASTLGPTPLVPLVDTTPEDLERAFAVNVVGAFRLTRAVAGSMVLRERGLIAFISSDAAVEAYPGWGAYGASKAAADHLARTFAVELAGVRVVTIDPGEMATRMHADAVPDADPATLADPADVARGIVALLSDAQRAPSGSRSAARDFVGAT